MPDAITSAGASPGAVPPVAPVAAAGASAPAADSGFSFHQLLSELNPLQYLPVIGTIYRSVTGDTIPEPVRIAGSLVVSGLTGGPLGVAMNVAFLGLEKATGIDPEKMGHDVLAGLGLTPGDTPTQPAADAPMLAGPAAPDAVTPDAVTPDAVTPGAVTPGAVTPGAATPAVGPPAATPWSPAQLAAYGVRRDTDGALTRSGVSGSDVLNDLVLAGLKSAPLSAGTIATA